ncbi:acetate/propionate family kinase [Nonomuraea aurantiaca]|uniref:acetate/propionate family kinase n=1 Tax=Nonomuraea aurantiaca TaxID=2878562 RepID=UPI001CD93B72|nr:acetate kinase [Nonomuraea aurantiaca]MCA2226542.1 acetate kinase [Nonomuraea aurantiaca]
MAGQILVLNTGSSSIKYELVDVESRERPARGLVERIGDKEGRLIHRTGDDPPYERKERFGDHAAGLASMLAAFDEAGPALKPVAVGHRVVHGGTRFQEAVLVDDGVISAIEDLSPLAPLHNPVNLTGIRVAREAFPDVPQVAVFDTAFHRTLPPEAYTYAVPRDWHDRLGVRRYGFHGTSCAYVSARAAELLDRDPARTNLIVLHLGNGASATAIEGGRSVDTSMGLTPLEGLVMGTRSGDVDPALTGYLARAGGMDIVRAEEELSRRSGLLALAGTGDMREVRRRAREGDERARLALDIYSRRIKKYIGAYYALLGRVDAIVFTGGVGEHDPATRAAALDGLHRLGIALDPTRNEADETGERRVSTPESEVAVLVVPTDEEWEIARQTLALIHV